MSSAVDDLAAARLGIAVEQRLGRHQDAAQAIAALAGLLVEEGLLQRMRLGRRAQALDRGHRAAGHRADLAGAGIGRLAVDQHHAAAALLQAAAVARAHQPEMVAQDLEQRGGLGRADPAGLAIYRECNIHPALPLLAADDSSPGARYSIGQVTLARAARHGRQAQGPELLFPIDIAAAEFDKSVKQF